MHPHLIHSSLDPPESTYKGRHFDQFNRFCTAHGREESSYTLQWVARPFPPLKNCAFLSGSGPRLIHGCSGPPESTTQTISQSVQRFLQGSRSWQTDRQTDRQTDHATPSVTIGRICVHVVLQCGLIPRLHDTTGCQTGCIV